MYIPELDAVIFLATEYLEGSPDQPTLSHAREALRKAAGVPLKRVRPTMRFPVNSTYRLSLLQGCQAQTASQSAAE